MNVTSEEKINHLLGLISSFAPDKSGEGHVHAMRTRFTKPHEDSIAGPEQVYAISIETVGASFLEDFAVFLMTRKKD